MSRHHDDEDIGDRAARDHEREPGPRFVGPRTLDPRGTVRVRFEPPEKIEGIPERPFQLTTELPAQVVAPDEDCRRDMKRDRDPITARDLAVEDLVSAAYLADQARRCP